MATIAGLLHHTTTADQAQSGRTATPAATANSSTTSASTSDAGTISSNDFLTLLVTEMKNQDPTATTDPNEYINQLVNVNSLQQLISINQTLTAGAAQTGTNSVGDKSTSGVKSQLGADAQQQLATPSSAAGSTGSIAQAAARLAPGNISTPAANSAANRVAQALSGRIGAQYQ